MFNRFTSLSGYALALACLALACAQRQEPPAPATPTTSYQGSVRLVSEFGAAVPDKSGVTVSVVDQSTPPATTDAAGSFTLNVPQGTQRLRFAKAGYGTFISDAFPLTTASITASKPVVLGQASSTYITYFQGWIYDYANHNYSVRGQLNAPSYLPSQVRYRRLFLAISPNVSPTNYKATVLLSGDFQDPSIPSRTLISDTVSRTVFSAARAGASPTDRVYGVIYGDNPAAASYSDPTSGLLIYPAYGTMPSEVFICTP